MKVKRIATFLLAVCSATCFFFGVDKLTEKAMATGANMVSTQDNSTGITIEEFLGRVYKEGDVAQLPDMIDGSFVLYDPNGNGYVNNSITFAKAGSWKLVVDTEETTREYEFVVYPSLATTSGSNSKVAVGKMGNFSKYDAQGRAGIFTQVAINESVTFNQIIDFSNKTKDDTVLEFSVFPETFRTEDASILVLTFTDVEDENNKLDIWLRAEPVNNVGNWQERCIYVRSGATGQKGSALDLYADGAYEFDGQTYLWRAGDFTDLWGSHQIFSMRGVGVGMTDGENIGRQVFGIALDDETKKLYCYTKNNGSAAGPFLVNDLDNKDLQGDAIWSGFKSGKCKLTISAKNYKNTTFTMLVTKLGEQTDFDKDYITNDIPAEIKVLDADMSKVTSLVQGVKFPIPKAIAYDAFGNALNVTTNVYTGYKTGTQANINIQSGSFTPTQLREYTLVYSCVDQWGNLAEKVYTLPTILEKDYNEFTVNVDSGTDTIKIGEEVQLKTPVIADNYVGRYSVEILGRLGTETVTLGKYENGKETAPIVFKPTKAGNWIIVYKYSDMYTNGMVYYTVEAQSGGSSYFIADAPVPKYIILNATCDVPDLYGYDYSGDTECWAKAKTYVTTTKDYTNAEECNKTSIVWTQDVEYAYYTYVLNEAIKQYEIPVVDVNYKDTEHNATAYFYGYQGTPVLDNDGTTYEVSERNGEYKLGFANQVQAYNYRSDIQIPEDANYAKVSVYLTDATDSANVLKLSYIIKDNDKVYYSINDGTQKPTTLQKTDSLVFIYQATTNNATFVTTQESIFTNLAGEKWTGFKTNMVWTEIVLEEVSGDNTSIIVCGINNQRFYAAESFDVLDMTPEFYQNIDKISAKNRQGTTIIIPEVYAADVLAVGCEVSFTAKKPDGSYVVTTDGITLNGVSGHNTYQVQLNEYGMYEFKYSIVDDLGRINKRGMFQITVEDLDAPTIEINAHASRASINDKLSIAGITITDNVDVAENCTYTVYVELPNYDVVALSKYDETNPFVFTLEGKYTVWYFVSDTSGNITFVSYDIYVK